MSHVNTTPHYGLPIYGENDIINPLTDFNDANSAIDTALYDIADAQGSEAGAISDINVFLGDKELETVAQNVTDAVNEVNTAVGNADTAIGNVAGDVVTLQTAVGNASTGLIHDVGELQTTVGSQGNSISALQTTVGDAESVLVKDVSDLKTAVGDATSGLVKDVADLETQNGNSVLVTTAQTLSGAINELAQATTFPDWGTATDISTSIGVNPYTPTSDGYLSVICNGGGCTIYYGETANDKRIATCYSDSGKRNGLIVPLRKNTRYDISVTNSALELCVFAKA